MPLPQHILDFINQSQNQQPDLVKGILSARLHPDMNDVANSALQGSISGQYVDPQTLADERISTPLKTLAGLAEIQKLGKGNEFDQLVNTYQSIPDTDPRKALYKDRLTKETTVSQFGMPIPVYDPATNSMVYQPRGVVAGGGYMPPPPAGQKYGPNNTLIPSQPSVRDQMRIQKSTEGASAASAYERLGTEAQQILGRYETSKASPILGGFEQWLNVVGMADKQKVQDFERLDAISKDMGAQALQQFGGNDTDKELMIAIQTNLNPKGTVGSNLETMNRKVLASQILQEKPVFEEEWLNRTGSLTMPDPETRETFSRAWMNYQKGLWSQGLGQAPQLEIAPPTPEEEAEYMRLRGK